MQKSAKSFANIFLIVQYAKNVNLLKKKVTAFTALVFVLNEG